MTALVIFVLVNYVILSVLVAIWNLKYIEDEYWYLREEERQGAGVYWDRTTKPIYATKWKFLFPISALITYFLY